MRSHAMCRSMVLLVVLVGVHETEGSSCSPELSLLAELAPGKAIL